MCDCYVDECKVCKEQIQMHLVDFSTGQDEVEVYCELHMPDNRTDGVVWSYGDGKPHRRAFVRWLTDNARNHADGNHPNYTDVDVAEVPEGSLAVMDEDRESAGPAPG
jgi:hypothetical protein